MDDQLKAPSEVYEAEVVHLVLSLLYCWTMETMAADDHQGVWFNQIDGIASSSSMVCLNFSLPLISCSGCDWMRVIKQKKKTKWMVMENKLIINT